MNDSQHPVESPEPRPDAAASSAFAARRRRLLKIAGGAAPASLLLVGRPVHATYTCNSTSAWGSAQLSAAQSVKLGQGTSVEGYSLAQWTSPIDESNPAWRSLYQKMNVKSSFSSWKNSVTLAACVGAAPTGLTGSNLLKEALTRTGKCSSASDFSRLLLVALLNHKLYPSRSVCVSEIDLKEMATGKYHFSSTVTWNMTQIQDYVERNNLARRG